MSGIGTALKQDTKPKELYPTQIDAPAKEQRVKRLAKFAEPGERKNRCSLCCISQNPKMQLLQITNGRNITDELSPFLKHTPWYRNETGKRTVTNQGQEHCERGAVRP